MQYAKDNFGSVDLRLFQLTLGQIQPTEDEFDHSLLDILLFLVNYLSEILKLEIILLCNSYMCHL